MDQTPLEDITHMFLQTILYIKIYHWQTESYARHKASDEIFSKLLANMDKLIESLQGQRKYRIFIPKKLNQLTLKNIKDDEMTNKLVEFKSFLKKIVLEPEFLNIRDEVITDIDQTLYLFTFQ
jgi:hypothetical protein